MTWVCKWSCVYSCLLIMGQWQWTWHFRNVIILLNAQTVSSPDPPKWLPVPSGQWSSRCHRLLHTWDWGSLDHPGLPPGKFEFLHLGWICSKSENGAERLILSTTLLHIWTPKWSWVFKSITLHPTQTIQIFSTWLHHQKIIQ